MIQNASELSKKTGPTHRLAASAHHTAKSSRGELPTVAIEHSDEWKIYVRIGIGVNAQGSVASRRVVQGANSQAKSDGDGAGATRRIFNAIRAACVGVCFLDIRAGCGRVGQRINQGSVDPRCEVIWSAGGLIRCNTLPWAAAE